jgi:hypothetical protein
VCRGEVIDKGGGYWHDAFKNSIFSTPCRSHVGSDTHIFGSVEVRHLQIERTWARCGASGGREPPVAHACIKPCAKGPTFCWIVESAVDQSIQTHPHCSHVMHTRAMNESDVRVRVHSPEQATGQRASVGSGQSWGRAGCSTSRRAWLCA